MRRCLIWEGCSSLIKKISFGRSIKYGIFLRSLSHSLGPFVLYPDSHKACIFTLCCLVISKIATEFTMIVASDGPLIMTACSKYLNRQWLRFSVRPNLKFILMSLPMIQVSFQKIMWSQWWIKHLTELIESLLLLMIAGKNKKFEGELCVHIGAITST